MKKTTVLTKVALISALTSVVLIFGGIFPSVALSFSALAGFFPAVLIKKHGFLAAFTCYLISGFLALLLSPVRYSAALFIFLFGIYQILKQWFERKMHPILAFFCKLFFANLVYLFLCLCLTNVFMAVVPSVLNSFVLTWVIYLAAFFAYDLAGSKWQTLYETRIEQ